MDSKITLDRETFKVLAADTRIEILKSLSEHKLTLTDLSEKFGMSPSTIKEHLDRLVDAGLIEADERGMKWKYYRLTRKGENIVTPVETKVWILLGTSLLLIFASGFTVVKKIAVFASAPMYSFGAASRVAMEKSANAAEEATLQAVSHTTTTLAEVMNDAVAKNMPAEGVDLLSSKAAENAVAESAQAVAQTTTTIARAVAETATHSVSTQYLLYDPIFLLNFLLLAFSLFGLGFCVVKIAGKRLRG
ncbi:MAG: winged helix-turn-helix domain-containing protein [Candidatus Altiarchaeota archaeon]|nr:winged helix-turn-helix domain-containing protein [Candidatus Altiarchaeota archaeon]